MNKEQLQDKRFEELCEKVEKIYKLLIGNGSKGIIERISKNEDRIIIISCTLSVIFAAIVGNLILKLFN